MRRHGQAWAPAVVLVPVALAVAASSVTGLGDASWLAEAAHASTEAVVTIIAGLFGALALRAYHKDGTVRLAVLGSALLLYAAVSVAEAVFASFEDASLFHLYGGAALVLVGAVMLAFPVRAVTRSPLARRHVVAFLAGLAALVALLGLGIGFRVDGIPRLDGGWIPFGHALDALAVVTLAAASVRLMARRAHDDGVPATLPAGLLLVAAHATLVISSAPWTGTWWLAHAASTLGFIALAWGALQLAIQCERTDIALSAAEARGERLASLGTLVAGVAHEINNPLMYVRGNIELAVMDVEDARVRLMNAGVTDAPDLARTVDQLRVSIEGTDRIARITKSLRAVAGQNGHERSAIDLGAVVLSAAELATIGHPDTVVVRVDVPDAPVPITGNESDLHQVILNLTRNAVEALGETEGTVVVRVTHRERLAELSVSDTGPGIPADVRRSLFTPFFTTKHNGTGLGLAIVHAIVEEHGGDVLVDSETGRGATFTLRFPIHGPTDVEERLGALF